MPELGIVIVSHSADIAKGLVSLIREVAPDIPLTATGGRMNLEMVEEFSDKEILIQQVPLIEGAYAAAALLQAGASEVEILSQINELTIQK